MYRFVEHTAELEVELDADSPEGVFDEARRAFAELAGSGSGEVVSKPIDVIARDLAGLLGAWLEELVFLADVEGFVADASDLSLNGFRLTGTVTGRRGRPRPLVKAVTLHRLSLRPVDDGWSGRVVLDV